MLARIYRKAAVLILAAGPALAATPASGHTYIVGLAADCMPATEALSEPLMGLFLALKLGDTIIVYDAPHHAVVSSITIPADRPVFERPAVRTQQLGAGLNKISEFLDARCATTSAATAHSGNLLIPEFFDELSTTVLPTLPRGSASILVIGSALYDDPRVSKLSMLDGYYPSDSMLQAKRTDSVFGVAEKTEALAEVDVHYCYTDTNWVSDAHTQMVRRWWSLFVSGQHGTLGTFTADMPTCFERFKRSVTAGAPSFRPELRSDNPEMLLAKPAQVVRLPPRQAPSVEPEEPSKPPEIARDAATRPTPAASDTAFLNPIAEISRQRPSTTRGVAKIGIRWDCPNADVDIYARGAPTSTFLHFGNRETPEGHFPHDFTAAPTEASALEYIAFTHAIDVSAAEAFINFFAGSCPTGPAGIVRIWFDNKVYEGRFAISATEGNHADRPRGQMTGPHWARINIRKIVHLE